LSKKASMSRIRGSQSRSASAFGRNFTQASSVSPPQALPPPPPRRPRRRPRAPPPREEEEEKKDEEEGLYPFISFSNADKPVSTDYPTFTEEARSWFRFKVSQRRIGEFKARYVGDSIAYLEGDEEDIALTPPFVPATSLKVILYETSADVSGNDVVIGTLDYASHDTVTRVITFTASTPIVLEGPLIDIEVRNLDTRWNFDLAMVDDVFADTQEPPLEIGYTVEPPRRFGMWTELEDSRPYTIMS
jgi:hypothetical protein